MDIKKKNKLTPLSFLAFILLFAWLLLLFLTPFTQAPQTIYLGNNGMVSIMDNTPYIKNNIKNPISRGVYFSGDFMCHQHADRSFFLNGNQMAYCARCTGIFLGMAFGAFIGSLFKLRIGFSLYIIVILPLVLDGLLQLFTSYESSNLIRIVTGTLAGTFTSFVFYYVFQNSSLSGK